MTDTTTIYTDNHGREIAVGRDLLTACTPAGTALSIPLDAGQLAELGAALIKRSIAEKHGELSKRAGVPLQPNDAFGYESPAVSVRADDESIVAYINRAIARNGARVTAVATFDELPEHVKDVAAANGVKPAEMRGITLGGGQVYVVQGNHSNLADLQATVVHEAYGHVGLRMLFGPALYRRLNKLYLSLGDAKLHALTKPMELGVANLPQCEKGACK